MKNYFSRFLRILRSYSIEEKVFSLILGLLVIFLLTQSVVGLFKTPGIFDDEGGRYTEGLINEKATLINPVYADFAEANRELSSLVFSSLTKYDPVNKAFVGDLADVKIGENKKTYQFHIKEGVFWHDGQPFSADDVFFTFHDVIQSPDFQNPVLKANFEGVEIKLIDARTIEFILNKPNSFFITNFNVGILPKHILNDIPVGDLPLSNFNIKPIGTGPYKIVDQMEILENGKARVYLALYDQYYGKKPKIQNIKFHIYQDAKSLMNEKGTLNVISKAPKEYAQVLLSDTRFQAVNYELPQYTAVFFNMESDAVKTTKVRVALQKAIDKSVLLEKINNKIAVDTPLMELNQSEWLYQPNVEEAKGALFDSGYKMSNDENDPYRKNKDGSNLKLSLLARQLDDPMAADELNIVINYLVESWKNVGVEIEIIVLPLKDFSEKVKNRDYNLLLAGESLGYNFDTYSYWHSSQANANGLNLSNFKSFAADSHIEKVRNTFNNDEKEDSLKLLAGIISKEIPAIFLYRPSYIMATDGKVKNINMENIAYSSDRFARIGEWCIKCQP
jgi:peptide/nickel transport system substrate-binding protein